VTDAVASYAWDAPSINALLRQLSTAMADEVDAVRAFDHSMSPK
jgi:hypothetical protein